LSESSALCERLAESDSEADMESFDANESAAD
jgi:hypothetical protein